MRKILCFLLITPAILTASPWPEFTAETKPWSRWWWLGSAVDEKNITSQLELFSQAGLGGVEICPIYGVKGSDSLEKKFLSPPWMQMLEHTSKEAARVNMKLDVTTGTGWPFGAPWVTPEIASRTMSWKKWNPADGELPKDFFKDKLIDVFAQSTSKEIKKLSYSNKKLSWLPDDASWTLYATFEKAPIMKVKRAAPGGEGDVLDPYSVNALDAYLAPFTSVFNEHKIKGIRSHFHDSFEYYGANTSTDLWQEFHNRRDYDLRTELPIFHGIGDPDKVARIKYDYRITLSEMHIDFMRQWNRWAKKHGSISRNQAHGAPANLLDLYAASDIPETEAFGAVQTQYMPMLKFASSATHIKGGKLSSAESFTWLGEHFQTPLSQCKSAADYLWLCGVNHLFFHGIPYSPADATWPGWQFYASVNMGPTGGLWEAMPSFNSYITHVQSYLQLGLPDHDVLIYFPCADILQTPKGDLMAFTMHNVHDYFEPHPFYELALQLDHSGITYDFISDNFLAQATVKNNQISLNGNTWKTIVIPRCQVMPLATMEKLIALKNSGASIIFQDSLPSQTAGWLNHQAQEVTLKSLTQDKSKFTITDSPLTALAIVNIVPDPLKLKGISFIRRQLNGQRHYFLVNTSSTDVDEYFLTNSPHLLILNPLQPHETGLAQIENNKYRLQLRAGESLIVQELASPADHPKWIYRSAPEKIIPLENDWQVNFVQGGPTVPAALSSKTNPQFWTDNSSPAHLDFSGSARYVQNFEIANPTSLYQLHLTEVADSAKIYLNGKMIAALWCPPWEVILQDKIQPGLNTLEIEITNLASNRIKHQDTHKIPWKIFKEINIVNKDYKPLDATTWPTRPSGLKGPVTLHQFSNK